MKRVTSIIKYGGCPYCRPFFPVIVKQNRTKPNRNLCDDEIFSIAAAASGANIGLYTYSKLGIPKLDIRFRTRIVPRVIHFTRNLWIEFQRKRHERDPSIPIFNASDRNFLRDYLDGFERPTLSLQPSESHIFSRQEVVAEFQQYLNNSRIAVIGRS